VKIVWVIIADSECSSCLVNAVYMNKDEADRWVEIENEKMGKGFYFVEQSQLIE